MDENRFYPSLSIVSLAPHFVNRIHNNRSIIQYIRENSYRNKFIFFSQRIYRPHLWPTVPGKHGPYRSMSIGWNLFRLRRSKAVDPDFPDERNDDELVRNVGLGNRRMADDVMREMNNNLRKQEQEKRSMAMKGDFLAAGIRSEVEGIKSALTDVYKWVSGM